MQISKQLMDAFYERKQKALDLDSFQLAEAWSQCESMVNNLHHGRAPDSWLPRLKAIIEDWRTAAVNSESSAVYSEALELVKIAELMAVELS